MARVLLLTLLATAVIISAAAQTGAPRVGKHSITLQWISWEKPGTAQITKTSGSYQIVGRQRSADGRDSLRIEGVLHPVSAKELRFTGKIITRIHHIHEGEPCVRNGHYTFLSTGKRRYWRLQEMLNCSGVETDYVDIYF